MRIEGDFEIMKKMIDIRKRELTEQLKEKKHALKALKRLLETDDSEITESRIYSLENQIDAIEEELKFYSAQYMPIRIFDVVINYKMFKSILQKTKKFKLDVQKGKNDTVEISWNEKGSKGKYTLYNLTEKFKEVIYIPELIVDEAM